MKKLIFLFVLVMFACNSEDVNDCFQTSGNGIQTSIGISNFDRILVNRNIELIIKEAPEYSVVVETGENLINDIEVEVVGNQLVLTDNNNCNFVRNYGITKIYVEAPNLIEIRTSTQFDVSSDGVLNYPILNLLSEDFNGNSAFTMGDFRLHVNCQNLSIVSNNLSFFYLEGAVKNLFVGFYSGSGRFEGRNLNAESIDVFHRGTNDMIINPEIALTGELRGVGDLISVNQPLTVNVNQIYTGQLIFE